MPVMRIKPMPPGTLSPEVRYVHDEIASLVGRSQSEVTMLDAAGALLGPFPPMLQYPQFGIPALSFLRTLDTHATLAKTVREVAILTVGGYSLIAMILNGFDIPAPGCHSSIN